MCPRILWRHGKKKGMHANGEVVTHPATLGCTEVVFHQHLGEVLGVWRQNNLAGQAVPTRMGPQLGPEVLNAKHSL